MGFNMQPFDEITVKRIEREGAVAGGTDGVVPNEERTKPIHIGGRPFTVMLYDDTRGLTGYLGGLSGHVKVQVNNSPYIDSNKAYHNVHPTQLGIHSVASNMEVAGVFQLEPSTTASDFANRWIDMPGGAMINNSVSAYSGSGAWRYIRLVGSTAAGARAQLPPTLTAWIFHTGTDHMGK